MRDSASLTDTLAVTDTTSFANIPWRSVFTDPQLQSLIEKGLANNPDLLNAALNVKMAEDQLKVAKLAFVPALTFTPQGTIASWDGNKATQTYSLPVTASWSLDLFGNLLSVKRGAQMSLLQTKDYQVTVKTNLIANIANLYYTLLMLDKQLELVSDMETLTKDRLPSDGSKVLSPTFVNIGEQPAVEGHLGDHEGAHRQPPRLPFGIGPGRRVQLLLGADQEGRPETPNPRDREYA